MSLRIGRWNCKYRVLDTQSQVMLAVDRLDGEVRRSVLDACEATLETAFANDPAVYVVRRLDVKFAMQVDGRPNEAVLARRWGARMGAEAVRSIGGEGSAANVVRFENTADFVANFLSDLLRDLAWQRWCYGAFARFRHTPRKQAVIEILREHGLLLAAIFRYLARLGSLRAVLDLLDGGSAAALWGEAIRRPGREPDPGEFRVFVRAAVEIADALGLWAGAPVAEDELLQSYLAIRPQQPDWTDRRALAATVWSILRMAERAGRIVIPGAGQAEARWLAEAGSLEAMLDWLELSWLRQMLAGWRAENLPGVAPAWRAGTGGGATPNQLRLLTRLRQILAAAVIPLDWRHPDSDRNALRLYAALAAVDEELAAHAATARILKILLAAWSGVAGLQDPIGAVEELRRGRVPDSKGDLPPANVEALRAAAALGSPAADVLHELLTRNAVPLKGAAGQTIATNCAGLYLLLRAITEARVPQMLARIPNAETAPLLLALGIHWAGEGSLRGGLPDPGLAMWSGVKESEPVASVLNAVSPEVCDSVLAQVRQAVASRATIDPSVSTDAEFPWRVAHDLDGRVASGSAAARFRYADVNPSGAALGAMAPRLLAFFRALPVTKSDSPSGTNRLVAR